MEFLPGKNELNRSARASDKLFLLHQMTENVSRGSPICKQKGKAKKGS